MITIRKLKYSVDKTKINKIINERTFDSRAEEYAAASKIVNDVKENGESAVLKYTKKFDGVELENTKVTEEEFNAAYQQVEDDYLVSLRNARENIYDFHQKQLRQNWFDSNGDKMVGQLINPLLRIGAYIPGGRAPYPSSVLMTVIPAVVAGVEEIIGVTPPGKDGKVNPHILTAAIESGVDELYKIGGAQAVAALAWGTETIKPVNKIVGPGNIYVTLAKKIVYGQVDSDMLAGPSEIMILADENAQPSYIAADMLSQAEHDPMASSILICTSDKLIEKTCQEIEKQLEKLPREKIARQSLEDQGLIIEVEDVETGLELVNCFAPEHFELMVEDPMSYLGQIKNAGAIFLGQYSPEPLGDYTAGPNHVLPTGGTAKYASSLNTDDYLKKSSIIYYGKKALQDEVEDIGRIARLEDFTAHARAAEIRCEE